MQKGLEFELMEPQAVAAQGHPPVLLCPCAASLHRAWDRECLGGENPLQTHTQGLSLAGIPGL